MTDDPLAPFVCDDCTAIVLMHQAPDDGDLVVVVIHDDTCPWYGALSAEQRTHLGDGCALVHVSTDESEGP
jgi:hypothetical protein